MRTCAGAIGRGPQGEQFFKLIEDEQGNEQLTAAAPQNVIAMMKIFPERLAGHGNAALGPHAHQGSCGRHGRLDLLSEGQGVGRVIESHVDRTVASRA